MFQLLGVEATKAQKSFDTTVISRVQKVGSIVPLESGIYALWFLHIEGGNIFYNSVGYNTMRRKPMVWRGGTEGYAHFRARAPCARGV